MKHTKDIALFAIIVLFFIYIWIQYTKQSVSPDSIINEYINKEIKKRDSIRTVEYENIKDSLRVFYKNIDKSINKTNKSINKILKDNENKINSLYTLNDSLKLLLADSILKANGYR